MQNDRLSLRNPKMARRALVILFALLLALPLTPAHAQTTTDSPESQSAPEGDIPKPKNPKPSPEDETKFNEGLKSNIEALQSNLTALSHLNTPENQKTLNYLGTNYGNSQTLGTDIGVAIAGLDVAKITDDSNALYDEMISVNARTEEGAKKLDLKALAQTMDHDQLSGIFTNLTRMAGAQIRLNSQLTAMNANLSNLTRTYSGLLELAGHPPSELAAMPGLSPMLNGVDTFAVGDLRNLSSLNDSFGNARSSLGTYLQSDGIANIGKKDSKVGEELAGAVGSMRALVSTNTSINESLSHNLDKPAEAAGATGAAAGATNSTSTPTGSGDTMASPIGGTATGAMGEIPATTNNTTAPTGSGDTTTSPIGGTATGAMGEIPATTNNTTAPDAIGVIPPAPPADNGGAAPAGTNDSAPAGSGGSGDGATPEPHSDLMIRAPVMATIIGSITPLSDTLILSNTSGPAGDEGLAAPSRPFTGTPLIAKLPPATGPLLAFAPPGPAGYLAPNFYVGICPLIEICSPAALAYNPLTPKVPVPLLDCTMGYYNPNSVATGVIPVAPSFTYPLRMSENCTDSRYKNIKILGPQLPVFNSASSPLGSLAAFGGTWAGPAYINNPAALPLVQNLQLIQDAYSIFNPTTIAEAALVGTTNTGPGNGTLGAMPNKAFSGTGMPHLDTAATSLVNTYPWLYLETDADQPKVYRGTGNTTEEYIENPIIPEGLMQYDDTNEAAWENDALVGYNFIKANKQCQPVTNTCTTQKKDVADYPYWVRLARDACTNQYILGMALNPDFLFFNGWREDQYLWNEQYCQPLILTPLPCMPDLYKDATGKTCLQDNGEASDVYSKKMTIDGGGTGALYDYRAWGYLEQAWFNVRNSAYLPAQSGSPNTITKAAPGTCSGGSWIVGDECGGNQYKVFGQPYNSSDPGTGNGTGSNSGTATYTGKLTTINQLATRNYERIWDPTHPFTPRWDMRTTGNKTDRDYGPDTYLDPVLFTGYAVPFLPCPVRCAYTPVDILNFRYNEFNKCINCRINTNNDCFWDEVLSDVIMQCIGGTSITNCVTPSELATFYPIAIYATTTNQSMNNSVIPQADDTCVVVPFFGCLFCIYTPTFCKTPLATHSPVLWPPCSTSFDDPSDANNENGGNKVKGWNWKGCGSSTVNRTCEQYSKDKGDDCLKDANDYKDSAAHPSSVTKCCNDLAQAVAPANTLKIRNTSDSRLHDTAGHTAEGYTFKEYFPAPSGESYSHMPYMRWWDTGYGYNGVEPPLSTITGTLPVGPTFPPAGTTWPSNYNPFCTGGQNDAIVGVGIESKGSGSEAGLCRWGGSAGKGYSCITVGNPDRLTSWYELKQYQTTSIRDWGMNCLPMQEKMWKWMGAEDGALFQAGRHFNDLVNIYSDSTANGGTGTRNVYATRNWPLSWRGFLADDYNSATSRFPNWGSGGATTGQMTGLDNAITGDIIYVTASDAAATTGHIAPFIAVVTSAQHNPNNTFAACKGAPFPPTTLNCGVSNPTNCCDSNDSCNDNIEIMDINNGKYPDVCGNTDYVGMGQPRTIYKEWLPPTFQEEITIPGSTNTSTCGDSYAITKGATLTLNAQGYCGDPKYSSCTLLCPGTGAGCTGGTNYWSQIHVYRPYLDERATR